MAGISAAQYVRKCIDAVVTVCIRNGKTYCVVRQDGKVIDERLDDPYGTLSWLTLFNIYVKTKIRFNAKREYVMPACSTFFGNFDSAVVKKFDVEWFESEVLPLIEGKTNIESIAYEYKNYNFQSDNVREQYEAYDWIVKMYVELRRMKLEGVEPSVPVDVKPKGIMEVISNLKSAEFVTVPKEMENLIPALKHVHPNAKLVDGVWICEPSKHMVDPLGLSDDTFVGVDMDIEPLGMLHESASASSVPSVALDDALDLEAKVVRCLTAPHQSLPAHLLDFIQHGGNPDILNQDKGGLGKHKLSGLGKVAGYGPLRECIDRLYNHFKLHLNRFSDKDVLNFAAGRIGRMTSDKKPVKRGGVYHLDPRSEK